MMLKLRRKVFPRSKFGRFRPSPIPEGFLLSQGLSLANGIPAKSIHLSQVCTIPELTTIP